MDVQKLKTFINGLMDITSKEISLLDNSAHIIYSTNHNKIGNYDTNVASYTYTNDSFIESGDTLYYCSNFSYHTRFIISIKEIDAETKKIAKIIQLFLTIDYENFSKENFIQGILLNTVPKTSINNQCQKHGIHADEPVQVILIEVIDSLANDVEEIIAALYPDEFLVRIKSSCFAFIKQVSKDTLDFVDSLLFDTILSELFYETKIATGVMVHDINDWHISYKTAENFMNLGKIFFPSKGVYSYNTLAIPLIINKLDVEDLEEILRHLDCNIKEFFTNHELLTTAFAFLKHNLNITDTSRHLFVHRNTLIYRLNKIQDITGYDLRIFQDAMLFNIIANVYQYIMNTNK